MHRHTRIIPYAVLLLTAVGCTSFSDSSRSISQIVSSPLTSISRSSSPDDTYREDVRDVTAAHVRGSGSTEDLRREIAHVAAQHGVSDWERHRSTYLGVGAGLKEAGYRPVELESFIRSFASTPEQGDWIRQGYEKE